MFKTLRARTTMWHVTVVTSALGLFAMLLYVWMARTLSSHHDHDLRDEADRIMAALSRHRQPEAALRVLDAEGTVSPHLMLRDAEGRLLFRSTRLADIEPGIGTDQVLMHAAAAGGGSSTFFTAPLARGNVRFTCVPLPSQPGLYLQVGRPLGDVDATLNVVAVASAVLIPVVVGLTSLGGWLIARRALQPVKTFAIALESIHATDLSRRVNPQAPDVEIGRLTSAINRLLDRLETSFTAMREFTADVSHQLQTPLAVMHGTIASARASSQPPGTAVLTLLAEEVNALSDTLTDLRDLALADADSASVPTEPIDVSAVFAEAAELVSALAESHELVCRVSIQPGLQVWGNAVRLRQVLLNLGENAVEFTPAGGEVRIDVVGEGDRVVASVSDTGPGIPAALLPHVFERRVHGRGADAKRGSGLGLAIVKRIVDAHGGMVTVRSVPSGGTTATVALPLANRSAL